MIIFVLVSCRHFGKQIQEIYKMDLAKDIQQVNVGTPMVLIKNILYRYNLQEMN